MAGQFNSGFSLKDDIASIWTDTTYHDVTIVCADGVELGACRAVLAARCPVFKAMLYGNMQESISQRVVLHDINSAVLTVVLGFIYTESIDFTIAIALEVYRAANFLLLPKLMTMVLDGTQNVSDLGVLSSLLDAAAASVPWSETSKDLYDILLKPFYARNLALGDLRDLSQDAIELLFTAPAATTIVTSEYDLLLGIVDWLWAHSEEPIPDVTERVDVLRDVTSMVPGCDGKIKLGDNSLLVNMMRHVDLTLVCRHRLKILMEAVDGFVETSPYYMSFFHNTCKNTVCPTGHPSGYRNSQNLQWDRSKIGSRVVVSDDGKVVELSIGTVNTVRQTARISCPGTMTQARLCEWDIVVESVGLYKRSRFFNNPMPFSDVGLVGEGFTDFDSHMEGSGSAWVFQSWKKDNWKVITGPRETREYGELLRKGDVVTLHLDNVTHTCGLSINGVYHGIAWTDLPETVYPAVTLGVQTKYRIKDRL